MPGAAAAVTENVRALIQPLLAGAGLELVDVELAAGLLRVTIDRPGGLDLDAISHASTAVSGALDGADRDGPEPAVADLPGHYVLEVSSPGIERPLRTPDHFQRFVGAVVAVRTVAGAGGDRRVQGTLEAADGGEVVDGGIVVQGRAIRYEDIERARTVFMWPVAPKGRFPVTSP